MYSDAGASNRIWAISRMSIACVGMSDGWAEVILHAQTHAAWLVY